MVHANSEMQNLSFWGRFESKGWGLKILFEDSAETPRFICRCSGCLEVRGGDSESCTGQT